MMPTLSQTVGLLHLKITINAISDVQFVIYVALKINNNHIINI